MFSPVVAAVDVSQIIGVCVLVISVLSWFVNVIKGNTPDGTPQEKKKPKRQSGRSEIEALLEQLSGEKTKPKPQRRESPKPKPQPPQGRAKVPPKPPMTRPGLSQSSPRVADTHLSSSNLGSEVRSHHLGNRIEATVRHDITSPVQQDIQDSVQHDLGNRIAAALPNQPKAVHPLVKVLRDPHGVRQAILLNEILQRPKCLRR